MLDTVLAALSDTAIAQLLRQSRYLYPLVNALHILALSSLFGAIMAFDLRLLGLFRSVPVQPLALYLPRIAAGGLLVALTSGLMLFSVQPLDYVENPAFLIKLALVLAGTIHAFALRHTASWRDLVRHDGAVSGRLRLSGAVSLVIWTAAIIAGRFIAF